MIANEKILRAARKVKSLRAAVRAVRRAQAAGLRVVFTNGCFDLLHRGHTRYLEQARALGDLLVVAMNSDASVRQLKGPDRPVVPAAERAEVLASLATVDLVLVFDELDPGRVIRAVRPDVLVKGGDWSVDRIVGADFVRSVGGKVRSLPYVQDASTSELIRRVLSASSHQPATPLRSGVAVSSQRRTQKDRRKPSSQRRPTRAAAPSEADS